MKDHLRALSFGDLHRLMDDVREAKKELESRDYIGKAEQAVSGSMGTSGMSPQRPMSEAELLEVLFTYHSDPAKVPVYSAINLATKHCAEAILKAVPPCPDRTLALEHIRDARMRANAAVACDGASFGWFQ